MVIMSIYSILYPIVVVEGRNERSYLDGNKRRQKKEKRIGMFIVSLAVVAKVLGNYRFVWIFFLVIFGLWPQDSLS